MTDETPKAKAQAARRPAAKKPAAAAITPVEPAPTTVAPVAAVAAAGWYPVAPGAAQQRWWDGTRWTDHVYDPATAAPAATATTTYEPLRAPAGVTPGTLWFWLLAVAAPVLQTLELVPLAIYLNQILSGNLTDPNALINDEFSPLVLVLTLAEWLVYAVCIVLAVLDWRALRNRGIPKPFHWAWSFFILLVSFPAVYVIGRSVVAKRRTGGGLAPLWVFVGLEVVVFIANIVFGFYVFFQFLNAFDGLLGAAGGVF